MQNYNLLEYQILLISLVDRITVVIFFRIDFFSNIGGALGLCIGLCIITIGELIWVCLKLVPQCTANEAKLDKVLITQTIQQLALSDNYRIKLITVYTSV